MSRTDSRGHAVRSAAFGGFLKFGQLAPKWFGPPIKFYSGRNYGRILMNLNLVVCFDRIYHLVFGIVKIG